MDLVPTLPQEARGKICLPGCLLASVLQAASARDFLNAGALEAVTRGRDLLKLAHCRTDSSPARPVRPPIWKADSRDTPPSFWALALHGSGWDAPWDYRGIPPPKDQSWGPDSIVLRLGPGVMIPTPFLVWPLLFLTSLVSCVSLWRGEPASPRRSPRSRPAPCRAGGCPVARARRPPSGTSRPGNRRDLFYIMRGARRRGSPAAPAGPADWNRRLRGPLRSPARAWRRGPRRR